MILQVDTTAQRRLTLGAVDGVAEKRETLAGRARITLQSSPTVKVLSGLNDQFKKRHL